MLTFSQIASGEIEIPAVEWLDVRRLWLRFKTEESNRAADEHPTTGVSYDARVLQQEMGSSGADVLAVFARVSMLIALEADGMLEEWKTGQEVLDSVYRVAASFPLPEGVGSFDSMRFVTQLRELQGSE